MGTIVTRLARRSDSTTTTPERTEGALERRAVEAATWGMPIVTVDAMRRAFLRDAALKQGDIVYWSRAANRQPGTIDLGAMLYYAYVSFNTRKGPVILDVPATAGATLSGTLLDAWHMPQAEIGVGGEDRGSGGRYLLLPPGHIEEIYGDYIPVRFGTHDGSALLRSSARTSSNEEATRALELVRRLRLFPLEEAASPPAHRYIDIAGRLRENGAGFAEGGYEPFWPDSSWIVPSNGRATVFTGRRSSDLVQNLGRYDALDRAPSSARGSAPLHVFSMRDGSRDWLEGGNTYRLRVPAKVPTSQFWCVTVYDLETAGVLHESARSEVNSYHRTVVGNQDGSVDVLFGPAKPCGKEVNWLGTSSGRRWFSAFRLYGPGEAVLDRSWRLPDIERLA